MRAEEIQLKEGEHLLGSAKISRAAIAALWLSVPCFLVVGLWGFVPATVSILRLAAFIDENLFSVLEKAIAGIVIALSLVWAAVAAVLTKKNVCYSLVYTDFRVVATFRNTLFEANISEIKNVFAEQSLWGKIFRYGALTVQAEKGSITVKNVCDPMTIQKQLFRLMKVS